MSTHVGAESAGQCPFNHIAGVGRTNRDWWPKQLRLELLHQHSAKSDPMGKAFSYAKAFKQLVEGPPDRGEAAEQTDSTPQAEDCVV